MVTFSGGSILHRTVAGGRNTNVSTISCWLVRTKIWKSISFILVPVVVGSAFALLTEWRIISQLFRLQPVSPGTATGATYDNADGAVQLLLRTPRVGEEGKIPNGENNINIGISQQSSKTATVRGTTTLSTTTTKQDLSLAVFYNIFLPDETNDIQNALRIIRQQLNQVGQSYAASVATSKNNKVGGRELTVYYSTVGNKAALPDTYISQICRKQHLRCEHLGHHPTGFEEITLQPLYQHCTHQNPNKDSSSQRSLVLYMHPKGSYHLNKRNNNWRYHMTRAITSQECITGVQTHQCNACGLLFMPLWSMFFPGNMWVADCEYIQQLQSPMQYQKSINATVTKAMELKSQGKLQTHLYEGRLAYDSIYGLNRFANEQWIGSHPDIMPCDMSEQADIRHWWRVDPTPTNDAKDFSWSTAPRQDIDQDWFQLDHTLLKEILEEESKTQKNNQYFLLPGFLWKWWQLYHRIPQPSSWVWNWFPNGEQIRSILFDEAGKDPVQAFFTR